MGVNISKDDVDQLVREPSAEVRSHIARKVLTGYNDNDYSSREKMLAEDILRLLLKDTEMRVRFVLAQELKNSMQVPHDIIWKLAHDEPIVAEPILRCSYILSEEDLIAIIRSTQNLAKLLAIASRDTITAPVTQALLAAGNVQVTKQVIGNNGAVINDESYRYILEEFSQDHSILEALVYRGGLPHAVAEELFALVSDQLKKSLSKRYRLSRRLNDENVVHAREGAMLDFLTPWMSQHDVQGLVERMHKNKRLTYSVIMRALCKGDLRFFETAMALLADVTQSNARILMMDPGPLGFYSFYRQTGLPQSFAKAIHILYRLAQEETFFGKFRCDDFSDRIARRIMQEGHDRSIENMPYLLSIIGRNRQDAIHIH